MTDFTAGVVRLLVWGLYAASATVALVWVFGLDIHRAAGRVTYVLVIGGFGLLVTSEVKPPRALIWLLPLCVGFLAAAALHFRS